MSGRRDPERVWHFPEMCRGIESVLPITVQAKTILRYGNKSFPAAEYYSELFRVIA